MPRRKHRPPTPTAPTPTSDSPLAAIERDLRQLARAITQWRPFEYSRETLSHRAGELADRVAALRIPIGVQHPPPEA